MSVLPGICKEVEQTGQNTAFQIGETQAGEYRESQLIRGDTHEQKMPSEPASGQENLNYIEKLLEAQGEQL